MLNIGCHLSVSKGFENMGKEALSIDANTFQFFTRNPRGGKAKQLDQNDIDKFLKLAKENNFARFPSRKPRKTRCGCRYKIYNRYVKSSSYKGANYDSSS